MSSVSQADYLAAVMATVRAYTLPAAASRYRVDGLRLLIGLCAALQRDAGDRPYYLGCRDAGRLLDIPFQRAAKWLRRLCADGVIVLVRRGTHGSGRANEYRYLGGRTQPHDQGRKDAGEFQILVNIITPYVPLTSSGKDPDLSSMSDEIRAALDKAIRVVKRTAPKSGGKKRSQKGIIRARIKEAAAKLSGGGKYLFSLRQLFYELRPYLIQALAREPKYGTFSRIVGEYEDEHGDIEHLYRDDRGTLYHPHTRESIPLGTRSVATYERPAFGFRSILFCEKEGLFPMLKHAGWPEQFDRALCSSKGFATRAVRALIRLLKESPEPITVFVAHDADGPGTVIFETLQRALKPYGIEVINLGLDPAEGRDMGLASEPVKRKKEMRVPVADYIPDDDQEWLQEHRIEMNAMTTPQFVAWLTAKVTAHFRRKRLSPKVVPPAQVLSERLEQETRGAIERRIVDEVMKAADIPGQVEAYFSKVAVQVDATGKALVRGMAARLKNTPIAHWTDIVKEEAASVVRPKGWEKRGKNAKPEA